MKIRENIKKPIYKKECGQIWMEFFLELSIMRA